VYGILSETQQLQCQLHPDQIIEKWADGYWHCPKCPGNTVIVGESGWAFKCDVCGRLADDFVCRNCTWQLDEDGEEYEE